MGRHPWPEIGAPDSDVDDGLDRKPRVPRPLTRSQTTREGRHAIEHGVDSGDDVLLADVDRRLARCAEGDVKDGPVLGDVDRLAVEHRLGALADARLGGELAE